MVAAQPKQLVTQPEPGSSHPEDLPLDTPVHSTSQQSHQVPTNPPPTSEAMPMPSSSPAARSCSPSICHDHAPLVPDIPPSPHSAPPVAQSATSLQPIQPAEIPLLDATLPDQPAHSVDLVASEPPVPPVSPSAKSELDDPGIKDLGWKDPSLIPPHLIRGISNDDLFMLIRRFNKQVQHVRAIPPPPSGLLDLEIADDEEFSPDKLRANLERFYMTIVVGLAAFGKHIARLRSWNEPRRTAAFALAYFICWYLRLLPALFLSVLLLVTFHRPSRCALFPPAPLAAVSSMSGNLQIPRAGTLGSHDSLSGAPESHQGEAVEQEASQFVASFAAIGAGTVMGQGGAPKRKQGEARADEKHDADGEMETEVDQSSRTSDDSIAGALPDPSDFALQAKNVKDTANSDGVEDPAAHVAKKSVEGAMWEKMRPVMRILADMADVWERFANAIEPVPPFPKWKARIHLAAVLVPLLVASFAFTSTAVFQGTLFFVGILFFSQPVLSRTVRELNRRVPNWPEYVEVRKTILRGVPTNAQLTLTLLRIAEAAEAPLPPPSEAHPRHTAEAARDARPDAVHPPEAAERLKEHDFAFDAENYEVEGVDQEHPLAHTDEEGFGSEGTYVEDEGGTDKESLEGVQDEDKTGKKRPQHGSKFVGFLKKTTRAGVGGILGMDHLKAKVGNEHAKRRLGAVASSGAAAAAEAVGTQNQPPDAQSVLEAEKQDEGQTREQQADEAMRREGPTSFSARMHGRKGRCLLVTSATSPCLSFVPDKTFRAVLTTGGGPGQGGDGTSPEFTLGLADIVALRKVGGFGWKGRLIVGWATGKEVVDGLEIVDRWGGRKVITAIKGRDELFGRLISVGGQKWECL